MTDHDPRDILSAVRARIDTPEHWSKGDSMVGNALCIGMAFNTLPDCDGDAMDCAVAAFVAAAGLSYPDEVPFWNDAPETTHADVMAAFDLAREALDANRERA